MVQCWLLRASSLANYHVQKEAEAEAEGGRGRLECTSAADTHSSIQQQRKHFRPNIDQMVHLTTIHSDAWVVVSTLDMRGTSAAGCIVAEGRHHPGLAVDQRHMLILLDCEAAKDR